MKEEILALHHVIPIFQNYQKVSVNQDALKMNIFYMITKPIA